ncbi:MULTISPECIES: hypothetical protein [unclassified Mycobacterium]|uniref:hypothetical protein n=1 Tax=unclassified Mycobacterium TaxID=2642494 RepID=UPI001117A72C|nr:MULTISPECIES: hypothetical protein [unclassified Mycobacterium]
MIKLLTFATLSLSVATMTACSGSQAGNSSATLSDQSVIIEKSQLRLKTRDEASALLNSGHWKPEIRYYYQGAQPDDPIAKDAAVLGTSPKYADFIVQAVCFYTAKPRLVTIDLLPRDRIAYLPDGGNFRGAPSPNSQEIAAGKYENESAVGDLGCDMSRSSINLQEEPPQSGPTPPYPPQVVKFSDLLLQPRSEALKILKSGRWWPDIQYRVIVNENRLRSENNFNLEGSEWDGGKVVDVCSPDGLRRTIILTLRPAADITPEIEAQVRAQNQTANASNCDRIKTSIDIGNFPLPGH